MSLIRRVLLALGVILLVLVVAVLLTAPQLIADLLAGLNAVPLAVRILLAVLIDALLLVALGRQLRQKPTEGLVVRARGVKAEVNIDSVQRQLNARVEEVPDVLAVQTEVAADNGNARIALRVRTRPDIVVPEKQKEITRVLRQVVEKQLGLRLAGAPVVHISLDTKPPLAESAQAAMTGAVEPEAVPEPPSRTAIPEVMPGPEQPVAAPSPAATPAEDVIEAEYVSDEEYAAEVAETGVADEWPAGAEAPVPPVQGIREEEADEPWRAFLLGDDDEDTAQDR